ncbi:MAG: pilus biosis protein, TadE family [Myxococcaceae bacterium]|nr:pilus biosis protein, TadE family [Myxococcaceae bacterium]
MPLMLFILLGTLQLFMMMHARILTQLAAFQVTRAGSLTHANCPRMLHAGILQVLPSIEPFAKPTGASIAANLANAFDRYKNNTYNGRNINVGAGKSVALNGAGGTGALMWIIRNFGGRGAAGNDDNFDQSVGPMRLETQVVFWFPMRVPFANWVIARTMLAHYNMQAYSNQNPLMIRQKANWTGPGATLSAEMRSEIQGRLLAGEYVFPIVASYTMRMMTPLKAINLVPKNCALTPNSL